MNNDFEAFQYRLVDLLKDTHQHIRICPDCRYYDDKMSELHQRVLRTRRISGLNIPIRSDNQFVQELTTKFLEAQDEYELLYRLRCEKSHDTHFSHEVAERRIIVFHLIVDDCAKGG